MIRKIISATFICLFTLSSALANNVVTLHSPGGGLLKLTPEAHIATHLKITGHIDASDFQTLKSVTFGSTQVLDLSEATIDAPVSGGCYEPITSDWIVGSTPKHDYAANTIPVHAFTRQGDNSVYKFHYGSHSLRRIILPANIHAIDDDAFYATDHLTEMEVPKHSTTARSINNALYNFELTRLTGIVPLYGQCLTMPSTVTSVRDSVFNGYKLCGLEIRSLNKVDFGKQGKFDCAYVIAPQPEDYAQTFNGIDVIKEIKQVSVNVQTAGELSKTLYAKGYNDNDLRDVRVSGTINKEDIQWLNGLRNLHFLYLDDAAYTDNQLAMYNTSTLCKLTLPQGNYTLRLYNLPFLCGQLKVPEGVSHVDVEEVPMLSEVQMPSTLQSVEKGSFSSSIIRKADFSACTILEKLHAFNDCFNLETLLLPPSLTELTGIAGPVENVNLPDKLQELHIQGWNIKTLTLAANLQKLSLYHLLLLEKLDASQAKRLTDVDGPHSCPLLQELDFSCTPLQTFAGLCYSNPSGQGTHYPQRIVVTGKEESSAIHSSLHTLRLPSTLRQITQAFVGCDKLEELDLQACSQLTKISQGIYSCHHLRSLRLPADIQEIGTIEDCPALADVYVAADRQVPTLTAADTLLTRLTLHIPAGCNQQYALHKDWSKIPYIEEYGYTVRTTSPVNNALLTGGGLYPFGASVTVGGVLEIKEGLRTWKLSAWNIGNTTHSSPSATFTPKGHMQAEAVYTQGEIDHEQADVALNTHADKACEINVRAYCNGNFTIVTEQGYTHTAYSGENVVVPVAAGKDFVAISANDINRLQIIKHHDMEATNAVTMESEVKLNDAGLIYDLAIDNLGCKVLDLAQCKSLEYLDCPDNKLSSLNLSNCPKLKRLRCDNNQLQSLDLGDNSQLETLSCYNNRITRWQINTTHLNSVYAYNNSFGFSQVSPQLGLLMAKSLPLYGSKENGFVPPHDLQKGDVLDLSHELTAQNGDPVSISLTHSGTGPVDADGGKYTMSEMGNYQLVMSCDSYPGLIFEGYWHIDTESSITPISLDGISMTKFADGLHISNLPTNAKVELINMAGKVFATYHGTTAQITRIPPGIYLIRISNDKGQSQTLKVRI